MCTIGVGEDGLWMVEQERLGSVFGLLVRFLSVAEISFQQCISLIRVNERQLIHAQLAGCVNIGHEQKSVC